ncbi:hypothetical protein ABIE45_002643 [Methylobacterium sp. OAE515]
MNNAVCPRCGLTDFGTDDRGLDGTWIWAEEFVRRCDHVHERRHLKDLRTHTCLHWAKAMQDAAEAQERRR